jgi:hypothetical protein
MTENSEFDELKGIVSLVRIPESVFAPNITAWVGAAL